MGSVDPDQDQGWQNELEHIMKLIRFIFSFCKFYGSWIRIQDSQISADPCGSGNRSGSKTLVTADFDPLLLMQRECPLMKVEEN
jgi:hypothetical protein